MMEALLYGLLLLATIVAALLLIYLFRSRTIEHRLKMLEAIADLSERVSHLENAVHANASAPVERKLDLLNDKLKDVAGQISMAASSRAPILLASPKGDISDAELVTNSLMANGFSKIHIVHEQPRADGPTEFRVEASKGNSLHKGSVFVSLGVVGETRLTPIYELFP
ncbi:MAG: hypothetical protein ACKVS6_03760 [Planctomycetota bacterium]